VEYRRVVEETARTLMLLDPTGPLVPLDSLTIIELVTALERAIGVTIPTSAIRDANFSSIEAVATMLEKLKR
jgi:acyl carrier protein